MERVISAFILLFASHTAHAGYQPLSLPEKWTFTETIRAMNPQDPSVKLGDFQKGITVKVIKALQESQHWLVEFERMGAPNITALTAIPDISKIRHKEFELIKATINEFPTLKAQLEADIPWPKNLKVISTRLLTNPETGDGTDEKPTLLVDTSKDETYAAWNNLPLNTAIDYRIPNNPKIKIEFWNKADGHNLSIKPHDAHRIIKEQLIEIERSLGTYQGQSARNDTDQTGISAVNERANAFYLPNDLKVITHYADNEYLTIEIVPFSRSKNTHLKKYDPTTFAATIKTRVKKHADGYYWIDGIPMISQGDKGYCAAATLARILNYYGYPVSMNSMANLGDTSGNRGTSYKNILSSIHRICTTTPFSLKQLKKTRRTEILSLIQDGIPLYWIVPGHARLLIGVHPEGGIVYSDSWGLGHEFKTMSWTDFTNVSLELWYLEPN